MMMLAALGTLAICGALEVKQLSMPTIQPWVAVLRFRNSAHAGFRDLDQDMMLTL